MNAEYHDNKATITAIAKAKGSSIILALTILFGLLSLLNIPARIKNTPTKSVSAQYMLAKYIANAQTDK